MYLCILCLDYFRLQTRITHLRLKSAGISSSFFSFVIFSFCELPRTRKEMKAQQVNYDFSISNVVFPTIAVNVLIVFDNSLKEVISYIIRIPNFD